MKIIDCGNYTDVATDDQCRCLISAGYTRAIVGTSFGSVARAQIAAFERNGLDVWEYVFPGHAPLGGRPWYLDCEDASATQAAIRAACSTPQPPTGIYTRRGWWRNETQDWNIVAEFPWLLLWEAAYNDPPPPFVPFGGWASRAIVQYAGSVTLCNLNVDLNIVEEEPVADTYTKAEIDQKFHDVETVIKLNQDALMARLAKLTIALQAAASAAGGP